MDLPSAQATVKDYVSSSRPISPKSEVYPSYSLRRSELVYKPNVFSHSVTPERPSLSSSWSHPSLTPKRTMWLTKDTDPACSNSSFRHPHLESRSDDHIQNLGKQSASQSHPRLRSRVAMHGPPYWTQNHQQAVLGQQSHRLSDLADAGWLDLNLDLHPCDHIPPAVQTTAPALQEAEIHGVEQGVSQEQRHSQLQNSLWTSYLENTDDARQEFEGFSPTAMAEQGFLNSCSVPPISTPTMPPSALPPTPPSSVLSEEASPAGNVPTIHHFSRDNPSESHFDPSTSFLNDFSMPHASLTAPPTPQELSPDMIWSTEDFANFLEIDSSFPNLGSLQEFSNGQAMSDSKRQRQQVPATPSMDQCYLQQRQYLWPECPTRPTDTDLYPDLPSINQADTLDLNTNRMPNYDFDLACQTLEPEAHRGFSPLFDDPSIDLGHSRSRRRSTSSGHQRPSDKDRLLIEWKNQGMSYKEIKARGGFEEAESTLRGRYRTLTKPKHLRVRKPEWEQKDVQVLLEAVDRYLQHQLEEQDVGEKYSTEAHRKAAKVPWKQVAEYMEKRGCYRYGNATVKKKYLKVMGDPLLF